MERDERRREGREGREVYLNRIIEELFRPRSGFSTTLRVPCRIWSGRYFGFASMWLPVLSSLLPLKLHMIY